VLLRSASLGLFLVLTAAPALGHDPSAWGGLFRSRDNAATWMPVDAGLFIGGALAVSVSPTDANHLLYATDSRLLRSRNGGRDWTQEAADKLIGPTLAVAFDQAGKGAAASSSAGVFYTEDGARWHEASTPGGPVVARAIIAGAANGRFYLAGSRGLMLSDDYGRNWTKTGEGVPDVTATALLVMPGSPDTILTVVAGELWSSRDAGGHWQPGGAGLPHDRIETVARDSTIATRLWSAAADQLYMSDDAGASWHAVGAPLPGPGISVRGIAATQNGEIIAVTTHRGLLRSADGGNTWGQVEGTLPVHLEAGPLTIDPHDSTTLYAGFALSPYPDIWRRAEEGSNLLSQSDPVSLAGGAASLMLLIIGGWFAAKKLSRLYHQDGASRL
jgi:photosystem II stability/assembly factor-like uncharacterized protein